MARESTPSSSSHPSAPRSAPPAPTAPPDPRVAAGRALLSRPLDTAQDALHALLEIQSQQARALRAWVRIVDEASHEAQAARDLQGLVAVVLKLSGRQVSEASSQWAQAWSQWLEGEVQLADRLRGEAAMQMQGLLQPVEPADGGAGSADWLAAWFRMRDQWQAAARHWMEATRADRPAP